MEVICADSTSSRAGPPPDVAGEAPIILPDGFDE